MSRRPVIMNRSRILQNNPLWFFQVGLSISAINLSLFRWNIFQRFSDTLQPFE